MNPADFRAATTEMEKNGTYQESEEPTKLRGFLVVENFQCVQMERTSLLVALREAATSQNKCYLFK